MKKVYTAFCLLIAVNICKPSVINAQVNVQDSLALVDLYNSTNGPHWYFNDNWLTQQPLSTWWGVNLSGNRVISLYLTGNKLIGSIPESLGNLTNMSILYLGNSQLSGSIPAELGNLTNLQNLDLSSNKLSGSIPAELGNLTNLQNLDLSYTS